METVYCIATGLILALGVAHGALAFKKFHTISPDALWFFSAALGLVCCGLINYINLKFFNQIISMIALGVDFLQLLFCIVLVYHIRSLIIYIALVCAILLFLSSAGFYITQY